jgi:NADH:quinone reductase (non-electrogenic)
MGGWITLRGTVAWWVWAIAHIFFLIDNRNRVGVALSWLWVYMTGQRSALLITGEGERAPWK